MTRGIFAVWITLSVVGTAAAGSKAKRKVKIESEPPGATVYLNIKEDGPVCTTPCTIDAPVGDTPIILELANHKQVFENLSVPAKKPVATKTFKLIPAVGTLNVKGPAGASITVDDEDKGKAPTSFAMQAGPHTVILTLNGKKLETVFVDVPSNDEAIVEGKAPSEKKQPKVVAEVKDPPEDPGDKDPDKVTTTTTTTTIEKPPRGPYITVAAAMDVGFRNFSYDNADPMSPVPLTTEKEGGQVLVGPVAEIFPGTLAGIRPLRGLAVLVRFGYGVNSQTVKRRDSGTTTSAKTFWRSFETSIRHRWTIKNTATLQASAGYVRDQYQFEGMVDDIKLVPDADYQSIAFGARGSLLLGSIEPYLTFENRIVVSGGSFEKRFDSASANGLRAAAGADLKFGAVSIRVEGAITRYTWTFKHTGTNDQFLADGGVDSIKYLTTSIGYAY